MRQNRKGPGSPAGAAGELQLLFCLKHFHAAFPASSGPEEGNSPSIKTIATRLCLSLPLTTLWGHCESVGCAVHPQQLLELPLEGDKVPPGMTSQDGCPLALDSGSSKWAARLLPAEASEQSSRATGGALQEACLEAAAVRGGGGVPGSGQMIVSCFSSN